MSALQLQENVPILACGDVGSLVGPSMTVSKIPLLQSSTRLKPVTESQRSLSCFLEKRRLLYHAGRRVLHSCHVTSFSNDTYSNEFANTTANFADNELSLEEEVPERKQKMIKNTKVPDRRRNKTVRPPLLKAKGDVLGKSKVSQVSSPNFIDVDSKELAERVVSQAKQRMKAKYDKAMSEAYSRPLRTSTPIPISQRNVCPKICRTGSSTPVTKMSAGLNGGKNSSPPSDGIKNCRNGHSGRCNQVLSTSSSLELSSRSSQDQKRNTFVVIHPVTHYLKFSKCH